MKFATIKIPCSVVFSNGLDADEAPEVTDLELRLTVSDDATVKDTLGLLAAKLDNAAMLVDIGDQS